MSLYGTRDAAASQSTAGTSVRPLGSRVRGVRIVVHGDDFLSSGPRHQLKSLEEAMDKHFESKHTVIDSSSYLAK